MTAELISTTFNSYEEALGVIALLTRRFLTVKDVADLIQVGEATVRQWIKQGELNAIDVGREWRVAPRDLEDFIERHSARGRTDSPADPECPPGNGTGNGA